MPIDYEALAKQHGGTEHIDYDALAAQHGGVAAQSPQPDMSITGFGKNLVNSGEKLVTDAAHAVMHPIDTVGGLATAAAGAVEKLIPGEQSHEKAADAIGRFYKDRYGSIDAVKKTMYEDPVGFLSDLSTVIGGGGAVMKGAATLSKSAKLADAAAIAGKVAEATNPVAIAGKAVTGAAGAIDKVRAPAAEALYRTAISPKINTARDQVRAMVETGLENKIPVTEAGAQKLDKLVSDLENSKQAVIDVATRRGVTIDPRKVATRLQDTDNTFGLQVNPEKALSDINKSGDEFLRTQTGPMPADLAQKLKTGTYQQIKTDYDRLRSAQVESQKALARGLKEELETAIPELKGLNEQQAKLLDLQPVLENAVNKAANKKGGGIRESGLSIAGTLSGGLPGGVGVFILHRIASDPAVRSRLAIAINKAQANNPGKFGIPSMKAALAKVDGYANALAQAGKLSSEAKQPEEVK